jgi:hypothetical protein
MALENTWHNGTTVTTYALRTGGFVQTVFAGIACNPKSLTEHLQSPAFAGYCLDAPDHLPAGSTRARVGRNAGSPFTAETTAFTRES